MRFSTSLLVCSALAVLSVSHIAAQRAPSLEGKWEGTLAADRAKRSRQLGKEAPPRQMVFVISTASDGSYSGKWLSTGGKGPADIGDVAIDGDTVRIGVPGSRGVWEGKLSSDGLTLAGVWRQSGKTTPLILHRTGNANDPAPIRSYSPGTVMRR
jgi:hypothetical protein